MGLKHWMVITPGLVGLGLSLLQRDKRHFWLWILLPVFLSGVIMSFPSSRYRQIMMLFWMPWAAFALWQILSRFHSQPVRVGSIALAILTGWGLSLGPLARCPENLYDRPTEYFISYRIYRDWGDMKRAKDMLNKGRERIPAAPRPLPQSPRPPLQ